MRRQKTSHARRASEAAWAAPLANGNVVDFSWWRTVVMRVESCASAGDSPLLKITSLQAAMGHGFSSLWTADGRDNRLRLSRGAGAILDETLLLPREMRDQ